MCEKMGKGALGGGSPLCSWGPGFILPGDCGRPTSLPLGVLSPPACHPHLILSNPHPYLGHAQDQRAHSLTITLNYRQRLVSCLFLSHSSPAPLSVGDVLPHTR